MGICEDCHYFVPEHTAINHCNHPKGHTTNGYATACFKFKLKKSNPQTKETNPKSVGEMRKFNTGATRDTTEGKLSYVKALSPIVLRRYVQYLGAHRKQADGSMRDFDNWKQGIPIDAYLDGLGRHFLAIWLLKQGFSAEDNHGPVNIEDTLCAIIFNASGWLHELIKDKKKSAEVE